MWIWIRNLLLTGMMVFIAIPALGEYYQYTDENGVLRFTDDLASVPSDQRPEVKIHESVKSTSVQKTPGDRQKVKGAASQPPAENGSSYSAGSWSERISRQGDELDRMQADLNRTFMALQNERTTLEAKKPGTGSLPDESKAYDKAVDALNKKIERYESQLSEFREKEKAFNAQYRK